MESKFLEFEIKKAEEDSEGRWIVEGLASTSDFDIQGDIVSEEALKASKDDLLKRPTVLLNHEENEPIGRVLETEVTKAGLRIKVMISKTAKKVWELLKEGVLSKFSIRAKVLKAVDEYIPYLKRFARVIKRMVILECSLVSVPANERAMALNVYVEKKVQEAIDELLKSKKLEDSEMGTEKELIEETLFDEEENLDEGKGKPVKKDESSTETETEKQDEEKPSTEEIDKATTAEISNQIQYLVDRLLGSVKDAKQVAALKEIKALAS
ncbi:MAG: hypothetical protein DRQ06_06115, partial [Candidatus Hydrothermota bacterium]